MSGQPAPTTLGELQERVGVWSPDKDPREIWLLAKAVKLGEEAGEVEGAILKMLEGRRTRDDVADELGDLMIVACTVCNLLNLDLMTIAANRFAGDVEHRPSYPIGNFT